MSREGLGGIAGAFVAWGRSWVGEGIASIWGELSALTPDLCDPGSPIASIWGELSALTPDLCDPGPPIESIWGELSALTPDLCDPGPRDGQRPAVAV